MKTCIKFQTYISCNVMTACHVFGNVIFGFSIFLHKVDFMAKIRNMALEFTHLKNNISSTKKKGNKFVILDTKYFFSKGEIEKSISCLFRIVTRNSFQMALTNVTFAKRWMMVPGDL